MSSDTPFILNNNLMKERKQEIGSQATQLTAEVLSKLAAKDHITTKDRKWITSRLQEAMDHERQIRLLDNLITDPEAFFKILFIGGAAVTTLAAAYGIVTPAIDANTKIFDEGVKVADLGILEGMTITTYAALMLACPRVFGSDGIKFKADASIIGIGAGQLEFG